MNTQAQQHKAVVQWRSLSPYRLRYICVICVLIFYERHEVIVQGLS
ncbi:MAG: hypothetical protein LBJ00_08660 [Planctomycetaceae bacterium]|nr:hypothetical protein [Planctomycetaceae bacterium]